MRAIEIWPWWSEENKENMDEGEKEKRNSSI